jgi:transcription elongation factor GreA
MLYGPKRPEPNPAGAPPSARSTITRDDERALRAELERLRHELNVQFASRFREARAFGGVSNNDDYQQIKEEKEILVSRIARLEDVLSSARVVAEHERDTATVSIGVAVKVKDMSSGAIDEYLLIGDFESPSPSAASAGSPIGRALIGRSVGEDVEVALPGGRKRRLRIISSRHTPAGREPHSQL